MKPWIPKLFVFILLFFCIQYVYISCKSDPAQQTHEIQDSIKSINIFLDNSASMEGYFKSKTEFTEIVDDMLTDLDKTNNYINKIRCFTISDSLNAYSLDSFQRSIRIDLEHRIGVGKSSKLDSILNVVLSETDTSQISIFITDGIMSGSDTEIKSYRLESPGREYNLDKQNDFKNIIKSTVDRFKDYGFIVQFHKSNFSGKYYKLDNSDAEDNFPYRPFYLIILGKDKLLQKFYKQKILKDPVEEIIISDCDNNLIPVQTLDTKGVVANFSDQIVKSVSGTDSLKMYLLIPDGFLFHNDILQNRYKIIYNGSDTALISGKILKSSTLKTNTDPKIKELIKSHSNVMQLTAKSGLKSGDKLEIACFLNKKLNESYHSDDDRLANTAFDKTFNLKYFIQGIIEGKGKVNNKLFSEIIEIK